MRAAALALREFPGPERVRTRTARCAGYGRVNVGVAVATDDALFVPTILDADRKSVAEIAAESRAWPSRCASRSLDAGRARTTAPSPSRTSACSVCAGSHAVINHPQAAILAVGEVALRPVVATDGSSSRGD